LIDSQILKKNTLESFNFSREILKDLEKFSSMVIEGNNKINLISKKTEKNIKNRHIMDSVQIIDIIDKFNVNNCTDLGSGAGFPGIVLGILMKRKKPLFKIIMYEKSYHKSNFLRDTSNKLKINSEVHQKNIFTEKNLSTDVIISRAFKPLPIILQIAFNNFKNFKHIIIYLGKNGKKFLKDALKKWRFEYEERVSLTSKDSYILKISNLKKKNV
jgi:16S rRNA (guanine527-N7)-methyltransferase|tara:strand:+ start:1584 stop:2228 length:645 start_codon:yes stop_codon:yes gene_type:complete